VAGIAAWLFLLPPERTSDRADSAPLELDSDGVEAELMMARAEAILKSGDLEAAASAYKRLQERFADHPYGADTTMGSEAAEALAAVECLRSRPLKQSIPQTFEVFWNDFLKDLSESNIEKISKLMSCRFSVGRLETDFEFNLDQAAGLPVILEIILGSEWRPAAWGSEKYYVFESESDKVSGLEYSIGFVEEEGAWRWKSFITNSDSVLERMQWSGRPFQEDPSDSF